MKTINRYNYEEFFLLYIDNELDAEQKKAVEKFAEQNADLSVELNMLMQARVMPEDGIVFTNKENLVRIEGDSINETNYEEYFLLYIDDELSTAKRREVETYILQHPQLQDEFTLLKQAILQPEIINYAHKKELYRTEGRRIIHFKPWRLAAAAVFIGVCALGWWLLQKSPLTNTVADTNKTIQQPKQDQTPVEPGIKEQQIKQPEVVAQQPSSANSKIKKTTTAVKNEIPDQKKQSNNFAQVQQILPSKNEIQNNDLIKQDEQPVIAKNDIVKEPAQDQEENPVTELPQVAKNVESNNNGYNVYPVAYKVLNTNDEDRSVHVAMLDLNKDKVKNLLKKAGRLFSNKSNDLANEDGKLQVANFEIETNKQ